MAIGFSYCMKNKWLRFDKASGLILKLKEDVKDEVAQDLAQIATLDKAKVTLYKKRKLIETK